MTNCTGICFMSVGLQNFGRTLGSDIQIQSFAGPLYLCRMLDSNMMGSACNVRVREAHTPFRHSPFYEVFSDFDFIYRRRRFDNALGQRNGFHPLFLTRLALSSRLQANLVVFPYASSTTLSPLPPFCTHFRSTLGASERHSILWCSFERQAFVIGCCCRETEEAIVGAEAHRRQWRLVASRLCVVPRASTSGTRRSDFRGFLGMLAHGVQNGHVSALVVRLLNQWSRDRSRHPGMRRWQKQ